MFAKPSRFSGALAKYTNAVQALTRASPQSCVMTFTSASGTEECFTIKMRLSPAEHKCNN
eukprot:CAMPEP_0194405782 /NCGR_PEP_ID=MMETSP0176-20130528/4113_1 /TAXON_ID=216777 /ORGANISM="Proboscia alata, Strain PI-D3" /LENGTH=59 /DNA_ID=CAMNT_0039204717 /DNA_START=77 /DNA_END=253 /DNA_ORIENTATION=-